MSEKIRQFFKEFEKASNSADAARSAALFSDVFLHSDPEAVRAVRRDDFAKGLPARMAWFRSLGRRGSSMEVTDEIAVGGMYTLAKTNVVIQFEKDGQTIDLQQTASYLLKEVSDGYVIIAYMNDQLLKDLLVEKGLLAKHE